MKACVFEASSVPIPDLVGRMCHCVDLQPSLTGNGAKVAIICNVTPASSQSEETWNTLRFADGAKRIKVSPGALALYSLCSAEIEHLSQAACVSP